MEYAHLREQSQSHRASIKRHWDEGIAPSEQGDARYLGRLPSLDVITQRRPSIPQNIDAEPILSSQHEPEIRGAVAKRTKLEGKQYNTFPRTNLASSSRIPPPRPPPPSPISEWYVSHLQNLVNPRLQILHIARTRTLRSLNQFPHHSRLLDLDLQNP